MRRFENQSILITAAASGLGLGVAMRLVDEGGDVTIWDRDKKAILSVEKHGIKIGYNSGKNYQSINRISHDSSLIQTKHCWCDTDGFVNIVCEQKHGLKQNSLVELKDSIFTGLYDVIYCNDYIFCQLSYLT